MMTDKNKKKKVLLILSDGMRPDGFEQCGDAYVNEILAHSAYAPTAQTVYPSGTLPCHMSLFHSISPERHGILTNTYVPMPNRVPGICEILRSAGRRCAMFYTWEQLRDITSPDSMTYTCYANGHIYTYEKADEKVAERYFKYMEDEADNPPDFVFFYIGWTDHAGHDSGWMSEEYLRSVRRSVEYMRRCLETVPEEYTVIITADHGGHARTHGSDCTEDMTIPVLFWNRDRLPQRLENVSILDLAPTIADILGVTPSPEWEGRVITEAVKYEKCE